MEVVKQELPIETALRLAVERLEAAGLQAKFEYVPDVLDTAQRLMMQPGGIERLYEWAPRLDAAGIFVDSDWAEPQSLMPGLVAQTLEQGSHQLVLIELISLLRILARASGTYTMNGFSSEQARHFLTQVLAHNLSRIFDVGQSEIARIQHDEMQDLVTNMFRFLSSHIGYEDILGKLAEEIWRILGQRPIQVYHVKSMITQIAVTLSSREHSIGEARLGTDRLISALFSPTQQCLDDPGIALYRERLDAMDDQALQQEAYGFARAMHDTGLVSDYHADFLRWLVENDRQNLVPDALGLSNTGIDSLRCYSELVTSLIEQAIYPETAQAVYGLAMLLERGILYMPPIAPGLWRQIGLPLSEHSNSLMAMIFGTARPGRVYLLAGVISILGQPLGIGQGNNPTCQAARAISMWSFADPDYLLQLVAQAARFDSVIMHFEGQPINSAELPPGLVRNIPMDGDPVSTILVPHLDRIYNQMGLLCADRGEDPHYWINPEFHGWWVGREFAIAVDIASGHLKDYQDFIAYFYASYHPLYNGNQPMIHPQPAGLAITDSTASFVGWHAITLLRVALDQAGTMRVYFYNPNNDSGQNWGNGVTVSTQGNGERFGESSLPFAQLVSRLYIFHVEPLTVPLEYEIPASEIAVVQEMAVNSWAIDRLPPVQA